MFATLIGAPVRIATSHATHMATLNGKVGHISGLTSRYIEVQVPVASLRASTVTMRFFPSELTTAVG